MRSSRLPGKVLMPIAGKVLLDHVLGRLSKLVFPVKVVVATSELSQDDIIARHCQLAEVEVFRGSETDVLDRYYRCARKNQLKHIVRLTADNPFTDIEELQHLIEKHLAECNDYTHSFGKLPTGVGAEIFTFQALEKSTQDGVAHNYREHVNEYIQEHPETFKIGELQVPKTKHAPDLRLSVDNKEDHRRACIVAGSAPHRWVGTVEAIRLCLQSA